MATTEQKMLTISVQVINVTCPCGGLCENEAGSTLIERDDKVQCLDCGTCYEIDPRAFTTFHQTLEQTVTRTLDEIYGALVKTFEVIREPGKKALVIQLSGYAQKLNCDPDMLRDALIVLHGQGRISTRKMNYPEHIPESWQIVFS
jgi:hypothetical protein